MTRELIADNLPLRVGPITIEYDRFHSPDEPLLFLEYRDFVHAALGNDISQNRATRAFRFVVSGLIEIHDLPILPPYEERELANGSLWGPYDTFDYHLKASAAAKFLTEVTPESCPPAKDPDVKFILESTGERAMSLVRFNTDAIAFKKLPGAFRTPIWPKKRLDKGLIVNYDDFAIVVRALGTSSAKAAEVFCLAVEKLGDDAAKEWVGLLDVYANPRTRQDIRRELYIKTQALHELLVELEGIPPKVRGRFNSTALKIIRDVLGDDQTHFPR